jgi:hypothetical protein
MNRPQPRRRKLFWLGLATFAVTCLTGGTMISMALFTDQQTDDSTLTTDATKIAALDLTSSTMMPGDTVTSSVTVENTGAAQLRYAVSQSSTNGDTKDLRSALYLVVMTEDTGAGSFANDGNYCDDANGTELHASAAMGASGNVVGDPTQGADSGDRTLNAGSSEVLCFYVNLPGNTSNAYQGATTTTTFTFDAEQTANN